MAEGLSPNQRANRPTPFLNTPQAAFYLGLSCRTLEHMRVDGTGPTWRRHGRFVRYHIDDLESWSMRDTIKQPLHRPTPRRAQ
jgi:predicted DNA-binding transcriptional regulator AlpA